LFKARESSTYLNRDKSGVDKETIIITVVQIALPRPEKLHEGRIAYSENMDRLLSMQESVIGELEKVHPYGRKNIDIDLLARYMLRSR
jgi:uncharacterized membrane protein